MPAHPTMEAVGDEVVTIQVTEEQLKAQSALAGQPESDQNEGDPVKDLFDDQSDPITPEPEPSPEPAPGKPTTPAEKFPKLDLPKPDETPADKPETQPAAAEAIKPHTEFSDARSLRPAYEALRVRCESAEKLVGERDARIAELQAKIKETEQLLEELKELRSRADNINYRESQPYQQAIDPLLTEAESIMARASELAMQGERDPKRITETIRRMVTMPDRGQRRQLASEIFDEADVPEAVILASQLADVDRRYRNLDQEWAKRSGEFLKSHRVKQVGTLREQAQALRREMDARLPAVQQEALREHIQEGEQLADMLLQYEDLPARSRQTVVQEAYWRVSRFNALWAVAHNALRQLATANAALKKRGAMPTLGDAGGGQPLARTGGNGKTDQTLADEFDEFVTKGSP